jgi:CMP-N-acetylneuraminic acid synthetase
MQSKQRDNLSISFFLPIRRNSKRIKNKNIKSLPGFKFGLTEIKIKQINKLRKIIKKNLKIDTEYVISTDSKKVIQFTKKYRWLKVFWRKKKLATDDSLSLLIKHVPDICKKNYILWTHVTSPLFNEKDYLEFIKSFIKLKKNNFSESAFSADVMQKFIIDENNKWISHNYNRKKWPRTQDLKKIYIMNSAAFISSRKTYLTRNDRLCNKPLPIKSRLNAGYDIDDYEDFKNLKDVYLFR